MRNIPIVRSFDSVAVSSSTYVNPGLLSYLVLSFKHSTVYKGRQGGTRRDNPVYFLFPGIVGEIS